DDTRGQLIKARVLQLANRPDIRQQPTLLSKSEALAKQEETIYGKAKRLPTPCFASMLLNYFNSMD
ncbi:hypothetical protein, partial [Hahella sp. HN01]|uniref:hypothetical protein n=1 Tax=Hahella sp. HN01 TaxID=2847262 RepID=UPI001C1ED2A9